MRTTTTCRLVRRKDKQLLTKCKSCSGSGVQEGGSYLNQYTCRSRRDAAHCWWWGNAAERLECGRFAGGDRRSSASAFQAWDPAVYIYHYIYIWNHLRVRSSRMVADAALEFLFEVPDFGRRRVESWSRELKPEECCDSRGKGLPSVNGYGRGFAREH